MTEPLHPFLLSPLIVEPRESAGLIPGFLAGPGDTAPPNTDQCWLAIDDHALQTTIGQGPWAGQTLGELTRRFPQMLVGRKHPAGAPFPVCLSLRNPEQEQPLGVHPSEQVVRQSSQPRQTNAKFWHCLQATPGSRITAGIAPRITGQQLLANLNRPALRKLVQSFIAHSGDAFLIPPGIVHSIGTGNLVWEVQLHNVTPTILSSWDEQEPVDPQEQQLAINSVLLEARQNPRISREAGSPIHTRRINLTPHCPYFDVEEIRLQDHIFSRTAGESFHLLTMIKGTVLVKYDGGSQQLNRGNICCIPACVNDYKVELIDARADFLRVSCPPAL